MADNIFDINSTFSFVVVLFIVNDTNVQNYFLQETYKT